MPAEWTPKNSAEFTRWFEKNQDKVTNIGVFRKALDLITSLEAKNRQKQEKP